MSFEEQHFFLFLVSLSDGKEYLNQEIKDLEIFLLFTFYLIVGGLLNFSEMKWLIILLILLAIIALVAFRYRRQILAGWQIWRMFRQMRNAGKEQRKPVENQKESLKDVPLVRCEKCGKWISPEGALKLRQDKYYCSSTCMERAAKLQSLVD